MFSATNLYQTDAARARHAAKLLDPQSVCFAISVLCRYVWLPAWVQDDPTAHDSQQASVWDRLNPLKLGTKQVAPPVQMDIRWYDGWSMTNFTGHEFIAREQWHPDSDVDDSSAESA